MSFENVIVQVGVGVVVVVMRQLIYLSTAFSVVVVTVQLEPVRICRDWNKKQRSSGEGDVVWCGVFGGLWIPTRIKFWWSGNLVNKGVVEKKKLSINDEHRKRREVVVEV